jgi:hypothetical protein
MQPVDAGSIVPSTRDLLQVIATRKKSMALVALLGPERPNDEAARLHELNVSAFAFAEPGAAMHAAAAATKTVPVLCLAPASDRDACLSARFFGADGVCVDIAQPPEEWDRLAKTVRTMRMLPLALAKDAAGAEAAVKAGARAVLVRAAVGDVITIAKLLPRSMTVVADVAGHDREALRELLGEVDAAIVPPSVHATPGFAEFVVEVDP